MSNKVGKFLVVARAQVGWDKSDLSFFLHFSPAIQKNAFGFSGGKKKKEEV